MTNAVNRDYGVPLFGALRADRPFLAATSGYAGTASDGLAQLDADHALGPITPNAPQGNVVQTAQLDRRGNSPVTLALGYGQTAAAADRHRRRLGPHLVRQHLGPVRGRLGRVRRAAEAAAAAAGRPVHRADADGWPRQYYLSVNVVKASEDKTFPGAIAAGLGSPWGQAVSAGDLPDGKPNYFGSYREVFARDLYEAFTGLLVAGDTATAQAATRFLFERQQLADGRMPRNSLPNGKKAPDTGGDQLDEIVVPDPDGLAVRPGRGPRALPRPHQEGGRLRRRARAVVRLRAVGGAGRVLAVDDRGRDRRPGRRRPDRRRQPRPRVRAGLPGHRRLLPALDQGLDGDHHRPVRVGALLHPAVQDRRPERGHHLQPRQRRPGRRPARGRRRRLPGADPARQRCRRTTRTCSARCRSWTRRSAGRPTSGAGLLPVRHVDAGHRGRLRRLLRSRPDELPAQTASRGRPATTAPGTTGRCCPASGPSSSCRTATGPARPRCWLAMDRLHLGHRDDARAGLGEPGPGRVAVRRRPDDRVDRLRQRQACRLVLAADLGAGPAGPADPRRSAPAGRWSSPRSSATGTCGPGHRGRCR